MNIPDLRFRGFEDEWEERVLRDIVSFGKGHGYSKGDLVDFGTPIILYGRLYTKYQTRINEIDTYAERLINSVRSIGGEVIVPGSGETAEDIARASVVNVKGTIIGGDLNIIYPSKDLVSAFLAYYITYGKAGKELEKKAQGKSVVHLHNDDLESISIPLITISEQKRIGKVFELYDNLLTQCKTRQTKLFNLKGALLDKMFPKDGNDVPEIRFVGFDGAWETREIQELSSISTGKSNTQDKNDNGKYPFYVRSPIIERSNKYLYDEEAVLTVGDGVGTGKVFHYVNGKYDLHQRVYRMYNFRSVTGLFFYYNFSINFYSRVMSMTAKTSVDSVRLEMIAEMKIKIPTVEEQIRIADFFSHLDTLISLESQKLSKLRQLKKALLKRMFV